MARTSFEGKTFEKTVKDFRPEEGFDTNEYFRGASGTSCKV